MSPPHVVLYVRGYRLTLVNNAASTLKEAMQENSAQLGEQCVQ